MTHCEWPLGHGAVAVDPFFYSIYLLSVEDHDSLEDRLATVGKLIDSPPAVHPGAPDWGMEHSPQLL